ncbi:MAG: hypothetical protein ABI638_13330 [Ignavibacteriota bacterium]
MNQIKRNITDQDNIEKRKYIIFLLFGLIALSYLGCSEITAPADVFPPDTPKFFTLIGGSDGQAFFRWEKNIEPDLKAYRLYRSENNITSFSLLVEIIATEYVDRFLEYDSTYYYYLTAIDNAGNESSATSIIDVQPGNNSAPQPPSRLIVSGFNSPVQGTLEIMVSWTPPDISDLKNYLIYRGSDSLFIPSPATFIDSSKIAIYLDRLVQLNQKYHYKIIAVDKGNKVSLPSKSSSDLILSSPVLISPANNTRFGTPYLLKWESVTDAVDYVVFVGNGPFSDVIWSSGKTKQTEINYSGSALQSSKVYYWWVGVYSKEKVVFDDKSEIPAQINSYSLINSFFGE